MGFLKNMFSRTSNKKRHLVINYEEELIYKKLIANSFVTVEDNPAVYYWILYSVPIVSTVVEDLLFSNEEPLASEFNLFQVHINKLDIESSKTMCNAILLFFLSVFLKNESLSEYLDLMRTNGQVLEKNLLDFLECSEKEREFYAEMDKTKKIPYSELHDFILSNCYGLNEGERKNGFNLTIFMTLINDRYKMFLTELVQKF